MHLHYCRALVGHECMLSSPPTSHTLMVLPSHALTNCPLGNTVKAHTKSSVPSIGLGQFDCVFKHLPVLQSHSLMLPSLHPLASMLSDSTAKDLTPSPAAMVYGSRASITCA